jgi:hypothetical protein
VIPDLRPNRLFDVEIVPCFRFDDVNACLDFGKISFIKIDVEGAELEALIGMKASIEEWRPIILCEVLFTDRQASLIKSTQRKDTLMQVMVGMGYSVWQVIKSADLTRVIDARKCSTFASAYWSEENMDLCDYLFVPVEKIETTCRALLLTRGGSSATANVI